MDDTKRTFLALVISFVIMVGWYTFFTPDKPAAPANNGAESAQAATEVTPVAPTAQPNAAEAAAPQQAAPAVEGAPAVAAQRQPVVPVVETTLSNDLFEIALSNVGGKVEQVTLLKYDDKAGPGGKPLELLHPGVEAGGYVTTTESKINPNAMFSVVEANDQRVVYSYTAPGGLTIEKSYAIEDGRYDLAFEAKVTNGSAAPVRDRLTSYIVGDFDAKASAYIFSGPAYSNEDGYEEVDVDDVVEGKVSATGVEWVAAMQNYFMKALIPADGEEELMLTPELGQEKVLRIGLTGASFDLAPGASKSWSYRYFAGPKVADAVGAVGEKFKDSLYYGWFQIIAEPLLVFLNFLYGIVGNYGIAILILTAMVKLIFWPLSAKSYKSMARMKELQPKVNKLKEKYAGDQERLNKEMMQLWKSHKVNPFGGCLPMLVQIPVFIALYRVLMYSVELRHAPFAFWLTDLSAPDPFYISPVIMGLSMFVQQRLTPSSSANEGQMKFMMYGMPILFTWLFKDFASGLVLYWLMNNLLSIAQQYAMLRKGSKPAS